MASEIIWLRLAATPSHHCPVTLAYRLNTIKAAKFEVRELCENAWLVLDRVDGGCWLKFAVMQYHSRELDDPNVEVTCVFHGEGTIGGLRECRHTYWGDGGYLFYMPGKIITAAIAALAEFFDDMKGEADGK